MFLICEAIESASLNADVQVFSDGEKAISFFDRLDHDESLAHPALVIIDINLPKKQGGEVLEHMRRSSRSSTTLAIVVSSSDSAEDRAQMEKLGADNYFSKPSEYDRFMELGAIVKTMLGAAASSE